MPPPLSVQSWVVFFQLMPSPGPPVPAPRLGHCLPREARFQTRAHVSEAGVLIRCAQKACWLKEEALGCGPPFPTKEQKTSPGSCTRAHAGCCSPGAQASSTASRERVGCYQRGVVQRPRHHGALKPSVWPQDTCLVLRVLGLLQVPQMQRHRPQAIHSTHTLCPLSMHTPVNTRANTRHSACM